MHRFPTAIILAALAATTFSQGKVKLNANFSALVSGRPTTNAQPGKTAVPIAPTRSEVRAHLAPPSKDNGLDSRGEGVPEPASMVALAIGFTAMLRRRKRA